MPKMWFCQRTKRLLRPAKLEKSDKALPNGPAVGLTRVVEYTPHIRSEQFKLRCPMWNIRGPRLVHQGLDLETNRGFELAPSDSDDSRLSSHAEVKVGVSESRESYRAEKDCESV